MFTPPVEPIAATELDQPAGASPTALSAAAAPLALPADATSLDDAGGWRWAGGVRAIPDPAGRYMRVALTSRAAASAARIPDLRPVRWLTHLHQDATLRGSDQSRWRSGWRR